MSDDCFHGAADSSSKNVHDLTSCETGSKAPRKDGKGNLLEAPNSDFWLCGTGWGFWLCARLLEPPVPGWLGGVS